MRLLMVPLCWLFCTVAAADLPREEIHPFVDVAPQVIKSQYFRDGKCERYLEDIPEPYRTQHKTLLNILVRNDLLVYVGDYRPTELEAVFRAMKAQGMAYSNFLPALKARTPSIPNISKVFSSGSYNWSEYLEAEQGLTTDAAVSLYPEHIQYRSCRAALIATDRVNLHSFAEAFSRQAQARKVTSDVGPVQVEVYRSEVYRSIEDFSSSYSDGNGEWLYYVVPVSFTNTDTRPHSVTAGRLAIRYEGTEQTFEPYHLSSRTVRGLYSWFPNVPAKSSKSIELVFKVPARTFGELYWLPPKSVGGGALWSGAAGRDEDIQDVLRFRD